MKLRLNEKRTWKKVYTAGVILFGVLMIFFSMTIIFSKYVQTQNTKGQAVSTSIYFTSNCLKTTNIQEGPIKDYYNTSIWDGSTEYKFSVDLRNYENKLLYNDKMLHIMYDLTFQIKDNPNGEYIYTIYYGSGANEKFELKWNHTQVPIIEGNRLGASIEAEVVTYPDKGDKVILKNISLPGGYLNANEFYVGVKSVAGKSEDNIISKGVKVTAVTKSPSYIRDQYQLAANLIASSSNINFNVIGNFTLQLNQDTIQKQLDSYSGFTYDVLTSGGNDSNLHEVLITWDNRIDIDTFDPYYQSVKDNPNRFGSYGNYKWMRVYVESYKKFQMYFYKTDKFKSDEFMTIEQFNNLVTVQGI